MKKILLFIGIAALILAGLAFGYFYYIANTGFKIDKPVSIYIDEKKDYDDILRQIKDSAKVANFSNFQTISSLKKYPLGIKTGRYIISPDENILEVIDKMSRGLQTPVKVTFNNMRLKEDLAKRISEQLMFDNVDFLATLNDSAICESFGFNTHTIVAMFIPNTYEFYWDVTVDSYLKRMKKEYDRFWTKDRLAKAEEIGLSPLQVSTLASIVEEECTYTDEYPIVAGLYMNRLKINMLLQADPTLKYAVGDFSLQRVLDVHKAVDSPYNTYKYLGLPPSPIRIPSIKGLDAVLNYANHNYLFMCAKEDFSGRHNFTHSLAEHNRNAARYHQALNKRKIYK